MNNKFFSLIFFIAFAFSIANSYADQTCDLIVKSSQKLKGKLDQNTKLEIQKFVGIYRAMIQRGFQMGQELQQAEINGINNELRNQMSKEIVEFMTQLQQAATQAIYSAQSTKNMLEPVKEFILSMFSLGKVMQRMENSTSQEQEAFLKEILATFDRIAPNIQ